MAYWAPVVIFLFVFQVLEAFEIIKSPAVHTNEVTRWLPGFRYPANELIGSFTLDRGQCHAQYTSKVIHCDIGFEVVTVKITVTDEAKSSISLKKIATGFKDALFLWTASIKRDPEACVETEEPAEVNIYAACKLKRTESEERTSNLNNNNNWGV